MPRDPIGDEAAFHFIDPRAAIPSARPLGLQRPILKGEVNFPVCLAPMVGLSHVAFRLLVRDYIPQGARTIWPTEMLNSRRLPHENFSTTPETLRGIDETQLVPQILGNEEEPIARSVRKLEDWGAQGIDINMGCPVNKALKHNYGVALMGDPAYAAEVVRMTVRNTSLPVSVKLRAAPPPRAESRTQPERETGGIGHGAESERGDSGTGLDFLFDFVRGIEDAGAAWICLHPRTAAQKRRGSADWSQIRDVRARVSIPVIGNGDVQTADDAIALLTETSCDMAMVGRALTARPWLLWQVGERLGWAPPVGRTGPAPSTPEEEGAEYGRALLRLAGLHREYFVSEELGLRKFRFFVRTSSPWLVFGLELYGLVMKAKTWTELEASLARFFEAPQAMSARTDLRS